MERKLIYAKPAESILLGIEGCKGATARGCSESALVLLRSGPMSHHGAVVMALASLLAVAADLGLGS